MKVPAMSARPFSSASQPVEPSRLTVHEVKFLTNGPYSLSVQGGACVGLCGESGIGKTQLLRAIADLIPWSGRIDLDGVESLTMEAPLWRRQVMMVPADPIWWYDQVGDHFPVKDQVLTTTLGRLGFSIDVLGWEVTRLSSGERQRLALARALAGGPRVLLLDEPTGALDRANTDRVEELLMELRAANGLALVLVSHDPNQLERLAGQCYEVLQHTLKALGGASSHPR